MQPPETLSETELRSLVMRVQTRIETGRADLPDYEQFIAYQRELARRAESPLTIRPVQALA